MKRDQASRKILFGVTGIGFGHAYRQMPIIDRFTAGHEVVIFAYDRSYECCIERYRSFPKVHVERVAVPFWAGCPGGLDFRATAACRYNQDINFLYINSRAMERAHDLIGRPDLVVSDYEPVSAQYAYALDAPLFTVDQQSKYLCGDFPPRLAGFGFQDEISRLQMFFPKAEARIACSFFDFPRKKGAPRVEVVPPVLREKLTDARRPARGRGSDLLVYLSSAKQREQSIEKIMRELDELRDMRVHVFLAPEEFSRAKGRPWSACIYLHGDPCFTALLLQCRAVLATAGHSLLSEAMHLGIPVYAVPVEPYEQHMNAKIIADYGFGVSNSLITKDLLGVFLRNLPGFESAISCDRSVLLRGAGQKEVIKYFDSVLGA